MHATQLSLEAGKRRFRLHFQQAFRVLLVWLSETPKSLRARPVAGTGCQCLLRREGARAADGRRFGV